MENKNFYITEEDLKGFRRYLQERENSTATIEKYLRDVRKFVQYAGFDTPVDKGRPVSYTHLDVYKRQSGYRADEGRGAPA